MCKIKRIMLIVMAAALMLASMALPAYAASVDEMTDVKPSAWYYDHVKKAMELGYFGGTSETTFEPEGKMTRAMFVQALANAADVDLNKYPGTNFADVSADAWYAKAVNWASRNHITSGTGDNQFSPNASITREQLVTMLHNFAISKNLESLLQFPEQDENTNFSDIGKVSSWAKPSMTWAVAKQFVTGSDGKLDPQGTATRAQTATIFVKCQDWLSFDASSSEEPDVTPDEETPDEETPSIDTDTKPDETPDNAPEQDNQGDIDNADHVHQWVHHDAVTEERVVADAWTEYTVEEKSVDITYCNQCGEQFTGPNQTSDAGSHIASFNSNCHGYHTVMDTVATLNNPVQHTEKTATIEISSAYDECSICGTKKPTNTHVHNWKWTNAVTKDCVTWHAYTKPIFEITNCQSYLCFGCMKQFHEHEYGNDEAAMLAAVAHIQASDTDNCEYYGELTSYDRTIVGEEDIPDQITTVVTSPAHLECTTCGKSFA